MSALEWIGSLSGIGGAIWLALNLASSKWAYLLFLISSSAFIGFASYHGHSGLLSQQVVFFAINCVGIYRWHGQPAITAPTDQ